MTLRSRLRSLAAPVLCPQYAAMGIANPASRVAVTLSGGGVSVDVTGANVVTALRPLTIGVLFPSGAPFPAGRAELTFHLRDGGLLLGTIRLKPAQDFDADGRVFRMFHTDGSLNACVESGWRPAHMAYQRWVSWRHQRRNPHNFQMTPRDLQAIFVFYSCPRPVALVSVEHQGRSNVFPMDLIGLDGAPYFSLALRSTSRASDLMKASRRIAVAEISHGYRDIAYALGRHHKDPDVDIQSLPFAVVPSARFGLPVPQDALRVREVRVQHVAEIGSHTWFWTTAESEMGTAASLLARTDTTLCHVHGCCRRFFQTPGQVAP
ncbi:MAG TPA: flavin reductase [Vicinamibacterales bacterium]|nr:flavin reductase [Vicinamibacterales bacterium]